MPTIRLNAPNSFRAAIRRVAPLVGLIVSIGALGAAPAGASIATWEIQSTVNPSATQQEFDGIGCNTLSLCMAVGTYSSGALVEVWDGSEWSLVPSTTGADLNDAECIDNGECGALGSRSGQAWGQKWTKLGGWQTMPVPSIGATSSEFDGADCAPVEGKLECLAVGSYTSEGFEGTLAMRWDVPTQKFVYTSTPNESGTVNVLEDISCNAVASCYAVGHYVESGEKRPLAMHWDGTFWSTESVPSSEAGGTDTYLNDVACSGSGAAARCIAVGANEGGAPQVAVSMYWNGEEWSEVPTAEPAGLSGDFTLDGASCVSTAECYAVGEYAGGESGETQTLIEEWDGAEWAVSPSPNPEGSIGNDLNDISCFVSSAECLTVGASQGESQIDTLALYGE